MPWEKMNPDERIVFYENESDLGDLKQMYDYKDKKYIHLIIKFYSKLNSNKHKN